MNDVGIGATIARERRAEGVTQAQLAERLGVTKAAVSKQPCVVVFFSSS